MLPPEHLARHNQPCSRIEVNEWAVLYFVVVVVSVFSCRIHVDGCICCVFNQKNQDLNNDPIESKYSRIFIFFIFF